MGAPQECEVGNLPLSARGNHCCRDGSCVMLSAAHLALLHSAGFADADAAAHAATLFPELLGAPPPRPCLEIPVRRP